MKIMVLRCSVVKYKRGNCVLYPLAEDKEKLKELYGRRVYAIVIEE